VVAVLLEKYRSLHQSFDEIDDGIIWFLSALECFQVSSSWSPGSIFALIPADI
jgi:hypothetical protein